MIFPPDIGLGGYYLEMPYGLTSSADVSSHSEDYRAVRLGFTGSAASNLAYE
jgi:hypothetical protein